MALPSSGTLSLNDIRVELQQASTNVSLGAMSNLVGFVDPDAVSEFYGFSYAAYNTFSIINTGYDDPGSACDDRDEDNLTLYFAGSGGTPACPSTSVVLYTNTALTNAFDGLFQHWRSNECNASYYILDTGFIEGITSCP
jgi:hypothetical protein